MAAFVAVGSAASSLRGAQVGDGKVSEPVCARKVTRAAGVVMIVGATSSPRMRRMQTRVPKVSGFSTKVTKSKIGKSLDIADEFFANSVITQFKEMSVAKSGVYDMQCTEGNYKGAAFEKRSAALSAAFRATQKSPAAKAFEKFEIRKLAVAAAHDCDHEEYMFINYPKLAAAYVMGMTEAKSTCQRYATPETIEEEFMAAALDKVNKARGCPGGVYSASCIEGNAKGAAEAARLNALGVAYRATMKSASQAEGARFASKKFARDYFGHGCDHEEKIFNTYPAVAAGMRSPAYGY
mmetsp:Transcript_9451/g.19932  ORF Transcript_9451/g.19932 Transcript_9451/m.19932 type:complete len:295 (-) Transcript_9451:344-1228(-)